jgi:hypothetical protein
MFPLWDVAIAPVLHAAQARRIVEIGAWRGETTDRMLGDLGPDAELDVSTTVGTGQVDIWRRGSSRSRNSHGGIELHGELEMCGGSGMKRIGVLVVACNASSTLAQVLDRIPADIRNRLSDVLVCDDHSDDATYLVSLGYGQVRSDLPLTIVRNSRNLGYGGNQRTGYEWAISHGLDMRRASRVLLSHPSGRRC